MSQVPAPSRFRASTTRNTLLHSRQYRSTRPRSSLTFWKGLWHAGHLGDDVGRFAVPGYLGLVSKMLCQSLCYIQCIASPHGNQQQREAFTPAFITYQSLINKKERLDAPPDCCYRLRPGLGDDGLFKQAYRTLKMVARHGQVDLRSVQVGMP
jgi:hypothetical protein